VTYQDGSQAERQITLRVAAADGRPQERPRRRLRELIGSGA
jgi:hypothetical protein